MTYRASSCVVVDKRLVGFIDMPSEPFAWVRFQFNHFNGSSKPFPAEGMDPIVTSPTMVFEEDTADWLIAVGEELVGLFDKYGIPFTAEMSEQLTYKPRLKRSNMNPRLRSFRLLAETEVFQVWSHFLCLVDAWLDMHATKSNAFPVSVAECQLMRELLTQFVEAVPYAAFNQLSWNTERKNTVRYMLAAADIRADFPDWQRKEFEASMVSYGYHHVW